jgi:hypothetical protein
MCVCVCVYIYIYIYIYMFHCLQFTKQYLRTIVPSEMIMAKRIMIMGKNEKSMVLTIIDQIRMTRGRVHRIIMIIKMTTMILGV